MSEATIAVYVPANLLSFGLGQDQIQNRVTEWLVFSLFIEGRVSSGQAAQLLNLSRVEFLRLLRLRGVAYIDYTPEELAEEFDAVESLQLDGSK